MKPLRVGELAKLTGISVRALHYYEQIGLVEPGRTRSGHRRYGRVAIERLQQIRSLQQLGFSLAQIAALLSRQGVKPEQTVAEHLNKICEQREVLGRLEAQLKRLLLRLRTGTMTDPEAIDVLLKTMEAMTMYDKHLTPEQLQQIEALHHQAGDAATEWQATLTALRERLDADTDPASPKVRALAKRLHQAAEAFMPAGDKATHDSVMQLLHDEPQARQEHGLDDALFEYLGRALAGDAHPNE